MSLYTTIPLIGDENLKAQLKVLASFHRVSVGQLVRIAIDEQYGNDLTKISADPRYQYLHKTKNAQE